MVELNSRDNSILARMFSSDGYRILKRILEQNLQGFRDEAVQNAVRYGARDETLHLGGRIYAYESLFSDLEALEERVNE